MTEESVSYNCETPSSENIWTIKGNNEIFIQPQVPIIQFKGVEDQEIGRLFVVDDKLVFEGNAEESAKIFFDFLKSSYAEHFNLEDK